MKRTPLYLTVATLAFPPLSAFGQSGSGIRLDEIIVTAQRKEESMQEVPISVNVVSGETLAARGIVDTQQLVSVVPGLEFSTVGGGASPFLRGIGSTGGDVNIEPSVATYIDGVYIPSSYISIASLTAIERVEVLKGPQGTLFGRNATGGVIQVVTRDPSAEPELEVTTGYANYDTFSGSLYATGGSDTLSANIAVSFTDQGKGWGENLTTGQDTYILEDTLIRAKVLWEPSDELRLLFTGDYSDRESGLGDFRLPPGVLGLDGVPGPSDPYDTRGNVALKNTGTPGATTEQYGISLRADYDADFGQLVSITGYRESDGEQSFDPDTTPDHYSDVIFPSETETFSQEFQFIAPDTWAFDLTAGLYYYETTAGLYDILLGGAAPGSEDVSALVVDTSEQKTESISAYAQADFDLTDTTKLTTGIRYTDEDISAKQIFAAFGGDISPADSGYEDPTWRIALDHAFRDDIHAYISYNRGIKGGGYDATGFGRTAFLPEQLDTYEIGLKSELFDNRVRVNASYFYNDFQDIQVLAVDDAGPTGLSRTTNAAAATIQGFEVDFMAAVTSNFTINGGFALMDGEYDDFQNTTSYPASPLSGSPNPFFDASGNETIRTPEFTGNLGVTYEVETESGRLSFNGSVSHSGEYYFSPDEIHQQDSYTVFTSSVGWVSLDQRFAVTLWGKNLSDETYFTALVPSGNGNLATYAAPRTYGITLRAKLGN